MIANYSSNYTLLSTEQLIIIAFAITSSSRIAVIVLIVVHRQVHCNTSVAAAACDSDTIGARA